MSQHLVDARNKPAKAESKFEDLAALVEAHFEDKSDASWASVTQMLRYADGYIGLREAVDYTRVTLRILSDRGHPQAVVTYERFLESERARRNLI